MDSFSNLDTTCSLATCTCKYSELLLLIGRSGEDIVIFSTLANTVLLGNMSWDTDFNTSGLQIGEGTLMWTFMNLYRWSKF